MKTLLPIVVLAVGGLIGWIIYSSRPTVQTKEQEPQPPLVRTELVRKKDLRLIVRSQGSIRPRTESMLVPQVSGRIVSVSPSFENGAFFEAEEVLVRIEKSDYELAKVQSEARVAQSELRLAHVRAEARLAREEWKLFGDGEGDPLTRHEPQVAEAEATLASAKAALDRAKLHLDRTDMKAPYAGRVWKKFADVGGNVTPATPVAKIYGVGFAEVRLPIPDSQLEFVDLPLHDSGEGATVKLRWKDHEWEARIVRIEAEIDPRTRMIPAIARVEEPYAPGRPPLVVGTFVEAEIAGKMVRDVIVLPRAAMRDGQRVLVVDAEDRLHFRKVDVLRTDGDQVVIQDGLREGERVCVSQLDIALEGMQVKTE